MIRQLRTVAMVIALAAPAWANWGIDASLSTTVTGKYIFRGAPLGPTGLFAEGSFSKRLSSQFSARADLWSYTRFAGPGPKRVQELDYTGEVTWTPSKIFSIVGGWVYYDALHPTLDYLDTGEAYLGVNTTLPGSPGVICYYDYQNAVGLTAVGHASYSHALGKSGWTGNLYGEVGLRSGAAGPTGLTYGDVRGNLNYDLGYGWNFGPTVDFWFPSAATDPANKKHFRTVFSLGFGYATSF